MHLGIFIILAFGGLAATVASAKFCGKLGSYDALCITEDAVFILSASPCHQKESKERLSLSIIYTKGKFKEHYNIGSSNEIKIPVSYGNKDVGVMLHMYHNKKTGYVNATLSLANFTDTAFTKTKKILLKVFFYMEKQGECYHDFTGEIFSQSPFCSSSKRTGSFSTYCISKETTSIDKASEGIFVVSMDPCSVPFSYWVTALFPSKNIQVMKRYTASKTDRYVPVENATCGIKAKALPDHSQRYPIKLLYGCNETAPVQLINDYYFPERGELCPFKNCVKPSPMHMKCKVKMITGDNKTSQISADLKLTGCGESVQGDLALAMEGKSHPMKAQLSRDNEFADLKFDNKDQSMTEHKMPEAVGGYVPSTGGHISLHIERLDDRDEGILRHHRDGKEMKPHLAYAVIVRHYGDENATVNFISPMFVTEFSLPMCDDSKHSKRKGRLGTGGKIAIPLGILAAIAAIVLIALLIRRRANAPKERSDEVGIPYKNELNETDGAGKVDLGV